jgi:hypothetical protein
MVFFSLLTVFLLLGTSFFASVLIPLLTTTAAFATTLASLAPRFTASRGVAAAQG